MTIILKSLEDIVNYASICRLGLYRDYTIILKSNFKYNIHNRVSYVHINSELNKLEIYSSQSKEPIIIVNLNENQWFITWLELMII